MRTDISEEQFEAAREKMRRRYNHLVDTLETLPDERASFTFRDRTEEENDAIEKVVDSFDPVFERLMNEETDAYAVMTGLAVVFAAAYRTYLPDAVKERGDADHHLAILLADIYHLSKKGEEDGF